MKKIKLPISASPFSGDCTRQNQLNRSVDGLIRERRTEDRGRRTDVSKKLADAGEITGALLLFTVLIGCAYLGMAL